MDIFIGSSLSFSIPLYSYSSSTFPPQSKIPWDGLPPETSILSLKVHFTSFSFFSPFIKTAEEILPKFKVSWRSSLILFCSKTRFESSTALSTWQWISLSPASKRSI